MAGPRVKYGFRLNAARDGLLVDEDKMRNVRRIFRMVGTEGHSMNAVFKTFERERIPTPGAGSVGTGRSSALRSWMMPTSPTRTRR